MRDPSIMINVMDMGLKLLVMDQLIKVYQLINYKRCNKIILIYLSLPLSNT